MQTSSQNQLLTLSLKMDTGLQAIDQLSQLLILLIAELQGTVNSPERSAAPILESPLLEVLLNQLSLIRQDLQRSSQPAQYGDEISDRSSSPLLLDDPLPSSVREDYRILDRPDRSIPLHPLHHKDVLEDDDSFGLDKSPQSAAVPAEMQVRRLMAQLTAAYNRIAALEEQLLSSHRHSYASQDSP